MAMGAVRRQLERVFAGGSVAGLTEGQLLDRFVAARDDAAFEALVVRHGPMVHSVCRRMLRDPNDVDDAFQATFLVLVRKAGSLRRRDLLGNWLYGVAFRVASRARSVSARRMKIETPADEVAELALARDECEPAPDPSLHEELHRLPEKYRAPVVLCYLEGLTHEEAAGR
jgi:RNA polymerase sigma factor (sigma-70 family)